ncbi:MAG TPA: hypothetical protein VNY05_36690 [Candidatus Acidoferrales bacterium]|jgi:hypothetical protein|nr:hypothetical protein [Candidatus Acidoferrales bacterium]
MTDNELDQVLNRWKTPAPSRGLRARVLGSFPRRELLSFVKPLRWAAAMAAVVCMLAIGAAQSGGGTLGNIGDGISRWQDSAINWIGDMWVGHIVLAFRKSNPSIYVDGELRSDVEFGGSGVGVWVRIPGEGKYLLGLRRTAFEGPVPPRAGRFDGHVMEFQAGGRSVRIESAGTYGFHERLPVYVMGPVQR